VVNRVLRGWCEYFRYGVSARTFGYLDYFTWHRVFRWLRKRHAGIGARELVRRLLPNWQLADGRVSLFKPQSVSIIRYRYRGAKIPTPWAPSA
jgi:RNA-directed DNA polymerase